MKYAYNDNIIEAFRIGVDPIPDWFMDDVTKNNAILHKAPAGNTYAEIYMPDNISEPWKTAMTGNYVARRGKSIRNVYSTEYFDNHYTPVMELKPVNAAEPVDPEKERFEALNEYYHRITSEVKLIYDAFVDAGFRADEAFTLTMKLMENPVKPFEKKSKSDILAEFNRQRIERKERMNDDSGSVSERCN